MSTHLDLAARTVVAASDGITHLTGSSPAIPGSLPNPATTICGIPTARPVTVPVSEVDCADCLLDSQQYWGLPGWRVTP